MTTIVVLSTTGAGNWTVPGGVTAVQIECIGSGGTGNVWSSPISPKGGGGGAYAKTTAAAVTPGQVIAYYVGAGHAGHNDIFNTSGEASWFGNATYTDPACLCLAMGSLSTSGGDTALCKGDVKFKGGDAGINSLDYGPGVGGGGGGGPSGAGGNASPNSGAPGSPGTGAGGQGGNGAGGAGGVHTAGPLATNGAAGTEMAGGLAGSGGGGGAESGVNNGIGGDGGLYGGGGGTGTDLSFGGVGGASAQGVIVLTFTVTPFAKSQGHIFG